MTESLQRAEPNDEAYEALIQELLQNPVVQRAASVVEQMRHGKGGITTDRKEFGEFSEGVAVLSEANIPYERMGKMLNCDTRYVKRALMRLSAEGRLPAKYIAPIDLCSIAAQRAQLAYFRANDVYELAMRKTKVKFEDKSTTAKGVNTSKKGWREREQRLSDANQAIKVMVEVARTLTDIARTEDALERADGGDDDGVLGNAAKRLKDMSDGQLSELEGQLKEAESESEPGASETGEGDASDSEGSRGSEVHS